MNNNNIITIGDTHTQTTRMTIHEVVRQLVSHLGPTAVAVLANVRDRKLPHRWARADGPEPRPASKSRLLAAHRSWTMVSVSAGEHVARNWFIGANPRLGEQAPILALREGKEAEVLAAAQAFAEGTTD